MKNVVILGGAYGGATAALTLTKIIPDGYRIILIDRNSHGNHLYVMPRYAVLGGYEHEAFIPYTDLFGEEPSRHLVLQTTILDLSLSSVTVSKGFPEHGLGETIPYEYCVYALGASLPTPIDIWDDTKKPVSKEAGTEPDPIGSKSYGIQWLKDSQEKIKGMESVLVVGGGALGVQFASDIKSIYPEKKVTLLHSRNQLLPIYSLELHEEIIKALEALAVEVYLETRLDLSTLKKGSKEVKSTDGRIFIADLIMLCTGQTPHSTFLQRLAPETINPRTKYATVLRSLQLAPLEQAESANEQQGIPVEDAVDSVDAALVKLNLRDESEKRPHYTNIFVIGDVADAFGAIKAGHTAYAQAKVAATNIVKLISGDEQLEQYSHEGLAIKVTVGLGKAAYQAHGKIGIKENDPEDLDAASIWPFFNADPYGPGGMHR